MTPIYTRITTISELVWIQVRTCLRVCRCRVHGSRKDHRIEMGWFPPLVCKSWGRAGGLQSTAECCRRQPETQREGAKKETCSPAPTSCRRQGRMPRAASLATSAQSSLRNDVHLWGGHGRCPHRCGNCPHECLKMVLRALREAEKILTL